jgi:hypothetical protein
LYRENPGYFSNRPIHSVPTKRDRIVENQKPSGKVSFDDLMPGTPA